ncbi:TrmH family RNA methyltransferase [Gordonibacter sp.]|uniref:TrmH family RNA methyltransferase n=1 Tax=Gordonibacter sp. TaxID=1968902 RepID=UPI002FCA6DD7
MPLIRVESSEDLRLAPYSGMTDAQLRDSPDSEQGLFIGESRKVIERALAANVRLRSLFLEEKWLDQTTGLIELLLASDPELPVLVATRAQFHKVTGYEVTRGALAAFERPALPRVEDLLVGARRVAVLEDVVNYTNIGATFRSAAALGIDAVLVTPSCHDPLYRRAARVSMGTVFQVPWTRIGQVRDWAPEGVPLLRNLGFKTAALALADDALPLQDERLRACERLALVLGTEGDGLAASTIAQCDYTVKIPMDHDVDSLNVAAASAVAFWELRTKWRG